jgi:hypothetical protein
MHFTSGNRAHANQDDKAFVVGEPISKLSQKLLDKENVDNFTFTGISRVLNSAAYKVSVFIEDLVENVQYSYTSRQHR